MIDREVINNILNQVTSGEQIEPDDLEQMQTDFRQEFSATKKKGEIIQMLVKFLEKFQDEDDEDAPDFMSEEEEEENPSRNLKNELNRAFNAFKDSFSIFRAAGQEDPDDANKNMSISDDKSMVWDSNDEDTTADFKLNAREKGILSKNFLKMVGISFEKKRKFQQTINNWRYKALEIKLQNAYLIHKTFFNFRRRMDQRMARAYTILRMQTRLQRVEKDLGEFSETIVIEDPMPKKVFNRKRNGRPEEKTEVVVLNARNGNSDDLEEEYEAVKHSVPTLNGRLGSSGQGGLLARPTENMDKAMDEFIMNKDMSIDPEISKTFTNLNRARYVNQVLGKLQKRNRDWAFYTLLNVNSKRTRALNTASHRMKGKLMMALHKNFSKDQVKSSYYKWYIKSNSHLLKKLASNMLIKLQLSNTVAAWRMISLVRTHKPRDERAIMLRLAKGLMELMTMTRVHQLQDARNAMQKMNPNHYTRKGKLLERTLVRLLRSKANKAKQALDRLRRGPLVCQKVFNRLGGNLENLKKGALDRLRFNRLSKNDQKVMRGMEILRNYMDNKVLRNKRALIESMKKKKSKGNMIVKRLMDKLGLSQRNALKKLQMNAMKQKEQQGLKFVNDGLDNMRKKLMLQSFGTHIKNKKKNLLGKLRKRIVEKAAEERKGNQKKTRLARMLLSSQTGKKHLVLSKLRDLKADKERKENVVSGFYNGIGDKFERKLYKALNKLKNFSRGKRDDENKALTNRDKLAKKLMRAMMDKQRRVLGKMLRTKNAGKKVEEKKFKTCDKLFKGLKNYTKLGLLKAMRKLRENKRRRNGDDLQRNRMAKRMANASQRKLGEAFSKLRAQGIVSESADQRKNRNLKFLLRKQKNRLAGAYYKLTLFNNLVQAKTNDESRSKRGMLLGLMGNQREKLRAALNMLRRTAEKGESKEVMDLKDKKGLLRLLGNRSRLLRERLLLKMGKKAREQEKMEVLDKLKRDGVLGLIFAKTGDKLKKAFYKLMFNRKRQENNQVKRGLLMKDIARKFQQKRRDTINKLRGQAKKQKEREEEKKRNMNMLVNMLKDQSNRKLASAMMKLMRNKAETAENESEQKELTKNLFKLLGFKGSDILGQAYRKLVNFKNEQNNDTQEKEFKVKNIGGLLMRSMKTKMSMALIRLIRNARKNKEKDQNKGRMLQIFGRRANKMRNNLLWKLISSQQDKQIGEEQRLNTKSKLLLKMGDNGRARMADALKKLMLNSLDKRFNENNEKRLKMIMLNLMKSKGNLSEQRALMKLRNFRQEQQAKENKTEADALKVLEQLKSKMMRMKFSALGRLRAFRKIAMKKFDKKKYLMEIMGNRAARMKDRLVLKLLRNLKKKGDDATTEKVSKNKMLAGLLLKTKNKLHTAFYRLMLFGIKSEKKDQIVQKIKEKLLGKLSLKGSSLLQDAFYKLWTFKNKARIAEGNQGQMCNLLMRTQAMRLREALMKLRAVGDKMQMALRDPKKRKCMNKLIIDLMDKNNLLRRRVLNRLRKLNKDKKQEELIKGTRPALTAEQLRKELENRLNNPKPDGKERLFSEIQNYLRRFPKEGRNQELLDAIEDGKIKNIEDLYNYMDDQNDPEGFKNVYDLLENPNLPVELLKKVLPSKVGLNDSSDVLKNLKTNPDTKLGDLMNSLQKGKKDGKNAKAFRAARGLKKVGDAIDEMLKLNDDGRYNKVLRPLRKQEKPTLSNLLNLLNDPERVSQEDADVIKEFLNRDNDPNALVELLNTLIGASDDGAKNPLAQNLMNQKNPSALDFVKDNKRDLNNPRNKKVLDALNGHDDPTLRNLLDRAGYFNNNGWLDDPIQELEKTCDDRLTNAHAKLRKEKDDSPQKAFLNGMIQGRPAYEDMVDYMDRSEDLKPLKERLMLLGKGNGPTPISSNDDLLDRLYLLALEEDSEKFEDSLDNVWDILNKLLPAEKMIDLLKASRNPRKYNPVIRKNKNTEGGLDLQDLYTQLKKNRLVKDEVKDLLNEGKSDPSRTTPVKLLGDYLKNINNQTPAESNLLSGLKGVEVLGDLLDKLQNQNTNGELDNVKNFIDYGMDESQLDKLRKFADNNRDLDPKMKNLSDYIANNPGSSLVDVLGVIAEDPEEYGAANVDLFLNGDADQQGGALGILDWARAHNDDGSLDKLIEGIEDKLDQDGSNPMTDLVDSTANSGGALRPALDKLNQKDIKNAMDDIMAYIRANNDDGKYDQILDDLSNVNHPDLNDLNNILNAYKAEPEIAKLVDLLNGKRLSNEDLLKWMKENNADGRYDDIIKALEENPDMSRAELMKLIRDKNENGELDDLLNFLTSEGHVQPKSAWEKFLDYLAKHRDDEPLQQAYDYLDKYGLKDPSGFRDYLNSINDDGRYDEMIRLLEAFLDDQQKESGMDSIYDFKLFKPLKKLLKMYLDRLRDFNQKAELLDQKKNTKLYQTFLKLNVSNRDKLRAAFRLLCGLSKEQKAKENKTEADALKVLEQLKSKMMRMKFSALGRLRAFRKIAMKKFDKKKYLMEIMGNRAARMKDRLVLKLLRNLKKKGDDATTEKVSKNKMLAGLLLKTKNKLHTAFYRLMLFGIKSEKKDQIVQKIKEKLLGKLSLKGSSLLQDAFYKLWTFKNKARIAEGNQGQMCNLLMRTQAMRLREALMKLRAVGDKMQMALRDPKKRKCMNKLIIDLMDKNNLLRRRVLNRLRKLNKDKKQEELIKGTRPALTAEQLRKELENRLNNPKPDGKERLFSEIQNYLRRFPKEGRNQELLDAIEDGKIKNIEDLYNYMDDQNDPEGFKNVYDLLENPNLPVELLKKVLPSKVGLNDSSDVLKNLKTNPDTKLGDLMNSLQKGKKDGKNAKAFRAARGLKKVGDAIDEMLKLNDDGRYNKVLRPLRKQEKPTLSNLLNLLNDPERVSQEDADVIKEFLNRDNDPNALVELLNTLIGASDDGAKNPLAQNLMNQKNPSALDFVKDNKRDLNNPRNKKVLDALNGHDDPTLRNLLDRAGYFNNNGWLDDPIQELEKTCDDRLTNAHAKLRKEKDDSPQKAFLNGMIQGRPAYEDMVDYMDRSEDLKPLKERLMLLGKGNGPTPISSNDDLLDRLYLLALEEDSEKFEDSLDNVWDILNKLLPAEKMIDLLKASRNPRKYNPVIRKNKNTEGGLDLQDLYTQLKKNRLVKDEVKDLLNEGKSDPSRTTPVKLLGDYLKNINNQTPAESNLLSGLKGVEVLGDLLDKLQNQNTNGELDNVKNFIDYGMDESQLDKLRKFADNNRDLDPKMKNLSDYIANNPGSSLVDVLGVIAEDPEEYGAANVDLFLNGDADQQGGALGILDWARAHNDDGSLDKLIEGIEDKLDQDGSNPMTDLVDSTANSGGALRPALDKLNQKDIKNAMDDIMAYIRANNDDGKYDQILDDLSNVNHPDLNDLNNILNAYKAEPEIAKLVDLLNGKRLSNEDLLKWMKENNADGRYDDIIKALEENPDMSRAELMKLIRDKNENGELDDLLNFLTSEGHVQPKSAWEKFLDYLAKHRDDEPLQQAYDYLDKYGLKDPSGFRDYLNSINDDGRYDEMIRLLEAFLDDQQKESGMDSIYDFKLFKPLKKLLKMYLDRLRDFNQKAELLDQKKNTKLYQTFLKLNVSNRDKLRAALRILRDLKRGEEKKELDNTRCVAKVLEKAAFASKKHDYRDLARALNKLIRFNNRKRYLDFLQEN